ncbi:hypothetical protein [Streptomyces sp. CFMR 7]|uniref:hypothetical protein n=1 Tax=Streptomyces sp. CFMR 7 TaxID=1649184 RepID=UPI0011AB1873|nr:hypothetical protein [Streptomyces sp. CFMR 7]
MEELYWSVEQFEEGAVRALKACGVDDPYAEYDIKGFAVFLEDDQKTNAPVDAHEWWEELKKRRLPQ